MNELAQVRAILATYPAMTDAQVLEAAAEVCKILFNEQGSTNDAQKLAWLPKTSPVTSRGRFGMEGAIPTSEADPECQRSPAPRSVADVGQPAHTARSLEQWIADHLPTPGVVLGVGTLIVIGLAIVVSITT